MFAKTIFLLCFSILTIQPSLASTDQPNNQASSAKRLFEAEPQIIKAIFQARQSVEWKLVVDGRYRLDGKGKIIEQRNVASDIKSKEWNGFAMAMCNILFEAGYAKKDDNKTHIIRIVDALTLKANSYNWRKASLGSCNCHRWEPFDK